MIFLSSVKLSLRNLNAHKKRSFLTMLGIIIGVGAVIIIMSVGAGAQSLIINELSSAGSNLFGIMPGAPNESGPPASVMGITVTTLKLDEVDDLKKISHVEAVTAYVRGVDTVSYFNQKSDATFCGVNADLLKVESTEVKEGRFFEEDENKSLARVVVLGWQVRQDLFGDADVIGEQIKIKKHSFKVIGVMEERGTVAFENKDTQIFVPVKTAQKILLGINHISLIRGRVDKIENLDIVREQVASVIRDNHNIDDPEKDDFEVRSLDQALNAVTSVTNALKFFLTGIAAISLLVGGIGIMNIMLVNIQERTKEIGLRKSVGATFQNILKQFLVEATVITLIGGAIGIIGGVLFSFAVAEIAVQMGYKWDFVVTISSILLGLCVSGGIGIIFGVYPAKKAAQMQPVEALRIE